MSILPDTLERYRNFIGFMLKYRNSNLFQETSKNALDQKTKDSNDDKEYDQSPEELIADLKQMGPTYIKMGQLLSTRPDLLPDRYLEALSTLQDEVEPIPFEKIHHIIEEEIGTRISKAFESLEKKPLASASIGQVHRAVLRSGKPVAVKIQRPDIRKKFLEDLDTLKELIDLAMKHSEKARRYAFDDVLEELRHILLQELDYNRETQNLIALGKNLKAFKSLKTHYDINTVHPDQKDFGEIHRYISEDLTQGKFTQEAKNYFIEQMKNLESKGADSIILGCTELPMLLTQKDFHLPLLDTTKLHAQLAVDFILS